MKLAFAVLALSTFATQAMADRGWGHGPGRPGFPPPFRHDRGVRCYDFQRGMAGTQSVMALSGRGGMSDRQCLESCEDYINRNGRWGTQYVCFSDTRGSCEVQTGPLRGTANCSNCQANVCQ